MKREFMPGPTPEDNQRQFDQSIDERAIPTDIRELDIDDPVSDDSHRQSAHKNKEPLLDTLARKAGRTLLAKWWESLKSPEVSNRLIAVATVVIAVAAGFTWREAHGAGTQTDKIIEADNRIAAGIEASLG